MTTKCIIKLSPGLYVIRKDKESLLSEIGAIMPALNRPLDNRESVSECRACRMRIKRLFENGFVDTRAKSKCIYALENSNTDNAQVAQEYGKQMFAFLCDLSEVILYSISFADLPSCRSLLDYSPEDAAAKAVDLVDNGIVKTIAKTLMIGAQAYHIKEIADVSNYYRSFLATFRKDTEAGLKPTEVELFYENKCNEELEYCRLASLKVAGKLTKEALEVGMEVIEKYRRTRGETQGDSLKANR